MGAHQQRCISRLSADLHAIDPNWTEDNILPLLAWDYPESAAQAWQGFLMKPHIQDIWDVVCADFVSACQHYNHIAARRVRLADILAHVYIGEYRLDDVSVTRCLRGLDNQAIASLLRTIGDRLKQEADPDQIWKNKLIRLFREIWPKEIDKRISSSDQRHWLIHCLSMTDNSFPGAVKAVEPLLESTPRMASKMRIDKKSIYEHAIRYPEASLTLFNALKPEAMSLAEVFDSLPAGANKEAALESLQGCA